MSAFIDRLLEKKGMTRADINPNSNTGKLFRRQGVRYTDELKRVIALPRRQWDEELAALLTEEFKRPGGTMVLRPAQAAALAEIHDVGGLLGAMRCGAGKTLVGFLAPKVLGSKRPLLLIPAKLKEKTARDWLTLSEHFVLPVIRTESYELLSRADSANMLNNMQPDLIIADECFGYETKILTNIGWLPIGEVVERGCASQVLSQREDRQTEWRPIVRRIKNEGSRRMVRVVHTEGSFVCTPEHKIWTERGYIAALDLLASDALRTVRDFGSAALSHAEKVLDERSNISVQGWERAIDRASEAVGEGAFAAHRIPDRNPLGSAPLQEPTASLQSRSCGCGVEDGNRGRRSNTHESKVEVSGSPQDRGVERSRVVRVEVLEQTGSDRYCDRRGGGSATYDLEVADNHNYFADGVLVSNCHRLKHSKSAVTRRVARYLKASKVTFVGLSGTITGRSLHDFWHLLRWTHGADRMPMPSEWGELSEWADAIDAKGDEGSDINVRGESRTAPGALVALCTPDEARVMDFGGDVGLQAVRRGFQRRLTETPGVISTGGDQVACSLSISEVRLDLNHLAPYFAQLRNDWCTADLHPFGDAVELWRHCREMVCGFYQVWDPRPPKEWLTARQNFCAFVRETLSHSRTLDSELEVVRGIKAGAIVDGGLLANWEAIKGTFKPNVVPRWVDDVTLNHCAAWLEHNVGLCWVEHIPVGQRLEEMTGLPYYGGEGLSADGRNILDEKGSCIVSIAANSEGHNLERFSKNLLPSVPPNGLRLEQLIARTHRDLQKADEVSVEVILACREQYAGFKKAIRQAGYADGVIGASQKLLVADINISDGTGTGPLWR